MKQAAFVNLCAGEMSATMSLPLGVWHGIWYQRYFSGLIFGGSGAEEQSRGRGKGNTWQRRKGDGRKYTKEESSIHSHRWLGGVQILITYLVILNILRSRRARKTLIPKDVPGLKIAQTTSKILPTVT